MSTLRICTNCWLPLMFGDLGIEANLFSSALVFVIVFEVLQTFLFLSLIAVHLLHFPIPAPINIIYLLA